MAEFNMEVMDVIDPSASKESAMTALDWCVQQGHHDLIKAILATHFSDSNISNLRRDCARVLAAAVKSGKEDILASLLKHVDDVHIICGDVRTETAYVNINALLGRAVEHGHLGVAETLIARGANVHCRYQGKPLLHLALSHRQCHLAKALVRLGCEMDSEDQKGETPLSTAIMSGNQGEVISWLLKQGVNPEKRMRSGKMPIHVAAGQSPLSVSLLAKVGCDVNAVHDVTGDTPLHVACNRACSESIVLLIRDGARFNIRNNNGQTPLLKLLNHATNPHDFAAKTRKMMAKILIGLGFYMQVSPGVKLANNTGRDKTIDVYRLLRREQQGVLCLQHMSRIAVRENISGRNFVKAVSKLDIAPHLKLYLQFRSHLFHHSPEITKLF